MVHEKTLRDILVVFAITAVSSVLAYALRIYVARAYTIEEYGLLYAMLAFFSFILIFIDLGLYQSMIKRVAEYRAKNDEQSVKDLFYTAFILQTFFAIILSIMLIIFSKYLNTHLFHNSYVLLFYIFVFWILTYPLTYFVIVYLLGYEKTTWWALSELIKVVSIIAVSIILYQFNHSITSVFIGYALTNVFLMAVFFVVNTKFFIPLRFHFKFRLLYPELLTYGIYIAVSTFAGIMLAQTDTLMITYLLGLKEAGIYQAAVPLASILVTLIAPISPVLVSKMSNLWAQKKRHEVETLFSLVQKYILLLVLPITLILVLFADLVIRLLFTNQYVGATYPLMILSFAFMLSAINSLFSYTLIFIGEAKKVMYVITFVVILNLFGNYFLIHLFGITGAAISTLIANIIIFSMLRFYIGRKIVISLKYTFLFKILFVATIFISSIYLCRKFIKTNYLLEAALCIIISGIVYVLTLFITKVITKEDILLAKKMIINKSK